ncbi:MAG: thioredoxin domain-containing protein [Candidatus Woesearchaeota archaeon]|nr:thioredoxin domain-containing protein [Candidatus Woesearchaeota archaeon]
MDIKWWVLFFVILGGIFLVQRNQNGKYDEFAQCLVDSGAVMYGAWWCPHCQEQKKEFGQSWRILKNNGGYVECSTADKQQTEFCSQQKIEGYPTWRFRNETELSGKVSFQSLAVKTGCKA